MTHARTRYGSNSTVGSSWSSTARPSRAMQVWSPIVNSMKTLREKLIKIGAKVVRHTKYVTFQMAEVAVSCRLYRAILERIRRLAALSSRASPI